MLEDVLHTNYSDTLVVGDFNFGCIKWETKLTIMRSVPGDLFLDTIGNLFLEQLVNEPTRIRNEQTSGLLDLVLTNTIYFVDEISVQDPIGKSDHMVLYIVVIANTGKVIPIERRLFYKGDYEWYIISNLLIGIIYYWMTYIDMAYILWSFLFCIKYICTCFPQAFSYQQE